MAEKCWNCNYFWEWRGHCILGNDPKTCTVPEETIERILQAKGDGKKDE